MSGSAAIDFHFVQRHTTHETALDSRTGTDSEAHQDEGGSRHRVSQFPFRDRSMPRRLLELQAAALPPSRGCAAASGCRGTVVRVRTFA